MNTCHRALSALLLSLGLTGMAVGAPELVGQAAYGLASYGQQSDESSGAFVQSFVTPPRGVVEAIRWFGFHGPDSGGAAFDNFVVRLDGVVQTGALSQVGIFGPGDVYLYEEYTLDITDSILQASVLSVLNDSPDVAWFWQSAAAVGNPDAPSGDQVAFSLLGHAVSTVPESGTPCMVLAGLVAAGAARRRSAGMNPR